MPGRPPLARVLWPPPPDSIAAPAPPIDADNRASIVLEVGEERSRMLLLADVDSLVEAALAVREPLALLKVAHHGSGSSSGDRLLSRVHPRIAVISSGRNNRFGHPNAGALRRLRSCGAIIHRTDEEGASWYEAGPSGIARLDWRSGGWRPAVDDHRARSMNDPRAAPRYP